MGHEKIVMRYRKEIIEGKVIDLIPLGKKDLPEVVRIRNQAKSRYFFNQSEILTLEMQENWYEKYLLRNDDIYWGIFTKDGKIIGTQRLYDITAGRCEQGSTVLDEDLALCGPYAAEAILLSLQFAFDVLHVKIVVNDNRFDNKNMNSISKKVGFKFVKEQEIRGVKYLYHELKEDDFNAGKLQKIINNWVDR